MPMKIKLFDNETKGYGQVDLPPAKYLFEVTEEPELSASDTSGRGKVVVKFKVMDGQFMGKKLTAFWNLPTDADASDHYCRNFWKDVAAVLPGLWNQETKDFDERVLKGLKFHATVSYKEGNSYPQFNGYRWLGSGAGLKAVPSEASVASAEPQKPQRFSSPA